MVYRDDAPTAIDCASSEFLRRLDGAQIAFFDRALEVGNKEYGVTLPSEEGLMPTELVPNAGGPDVLPNPVPAPDPEPPEPDPTPEPSPVPPVPEPAPAF